MDVTGGEATQFHPFAGATSVQSAITLCQEKTKHGSPCTNNKLLTIVC